MFEGSPCLRQKKFTIQVVSDVALPGMLEERHINATQSKLQRIQSAVLHYLILKRINFFHKACGVTSRFLPLLHLLDISRQ